MSATTTTPGSSSNPALSSRSFQRAIEAMPAGETMTVSGACARSLVLVAIVAAAAWVVGDMTISGNDSAAALGIGGAIAGFVVALVTIFKPNVAHVTAPLYAVLQGLFVGYISATLDIEFEGIVLQAVGATFAVFLVMLTLYATRVIRVTQRFRMIVVGATLSILVFYLVTIVLGLFGVDTGAVVGNSTLSIVISVAIIIIAALNLALDFDFIEAGANAGAPRRMEWYAAFGVLVTLIWLYLEILRLIAATRSR